MQQRVPKSRQVFLYIFLFLPLFTRAQDQTTSISGIVQDENGGSIPGASIIARTSQTDLTSGTLSDATGVFRLSKLTAGRSYNLVISFIGYETQTIADVKPGTARPLTIKLKESTSVLEQVVVVGYGSQRRKEITGAIASVRASDLKDQPVANLEQALAGKLAGVQVLQNTGAPGGSMSIRIRGINSISAGTEPLYVIDGFPISNDLKNLQGSTDVINMSGIASFQKSPNPMSTLNPDDIESIEVLKDASSASIYGSRASNGVILVTTKRGKKDGKPSFSYTAYGGVQEVSRKIKLMDAYQWSKLVYDAKNTAYLDANPKGSITDDNTVRANSNYQLPPEIAPYLAGTPGLTNTDWQDAIFRRAAIQNHTLSASGGNDKTQYYISGNYFDQQGTVLASAYKRYGVRVNLTTQLTSKFKVGLGLNPTFDHYDLVNTEGPFVYDGVINNALKATPIFPVYNSDGSLAVNRQNVLAYGFSGGENPVALATQIKDKLDHVRTLGNLFGEYQLLEGLTFKTYFGADLNYFNRNYYRPSTLGSYRPVQQPAPTNPKGSAQSASAKNWLWENTLTYAYTLRQNHKFNLLLGYTSQKNRTDASEVDGTGYPNDAVQTINAASTTSGTSTASEWSLLSYLGRLNYNFSDKYFVSASLRRDGSSRFGTNNKWGYFPSVSGAWLVSSENFFRAPAITELKLRASYGITGNFQISNYGSLDLLSANNYVLGSGLGTVVNGVGLSQPANPDLTWEKTAQLNIGVDVGLLQNRIYLSADYYRSQTRDLLLSVNVPLSSGFATALKNVGRVQNTGVEFGVTTHNTVGAFKWNTNFNISANRNKVLQLGPNGAPIISDGGVASTFITQVGSPIGSYYGYVNGGVFKNQAEIDAYPHYATAKPGDRKFIDVNNDGKIDANDRTLIGSYFPKFIWGLTNEFRYKGFDLSVSLQAVEGNKILNLQRRYLFNSEGNANQMIEDLNYWKSPTDPGDGNVIRANRVTNANSAQISSFHVEDGSYVRLRNVTLGYTVNRNWLGSKISGIRVYATAQNLYTWTKYTGYNPEVNARPETPLSQGEDYGTYPLPRTYTVGVNLSF